jgi:hypothetical protein
LPVLEDSLALALVEAERLMGEAGIPLLSFCVPKSHVCCVCVCVWVCVYVC